MSVSLWPRRVALIAALGLVAPTAARARAADECPAPPEDLATLIPDDASLAVGADIDATTDTPLWAELEPALRSDLVIGESLRMLTKCGVEIDRTYTVIAARNRGSGRYLALQGRRVGEAETLECMARQLAARSDGAVPWQPGQRGCHATLELDDGVIFVPNAYTLIFASRRWVDPISQRWQSGDAPPLPESLRDSIDAVDRERSHLWVAARVSEPERESMPGAWIRETSWLAVGIELDTGIDARLTTESTSVAEAANTREYIIAGLKSFAAKLTDKGAPLALGKNPRVGVEGRRVQTRIYISRRELLSIRDALGRQIRGRGLF